MADYSNTFDTPQAPITTADFGQAGGGTVSSATNTTPYIAAENGLAILKATAGIVAYLVAAKSPSTVECSAQLTFESADGQVALILGGAGNGNAASTRGTGYDVSHSGSTLSVRKKSTTADPVLVGEAITHVRSAGQVMRASVILNATSGKYEAVVFINGREVLRRELPTTPVVGRTGFLINGTGNGIREFHSGSLAYVAALPNGGPTAPPAKPLNVALVRPTRSRVGVSWGSVADAFSYRVEYKLLADANWTVSPELTVTSLELVSLPVGNYKLRVFALNSAGVSQSSDEVTFEVSNTVVVEIRIPILNDYGEIPLENMPDGYAELVGLADLDDVEGPAAKALLNFLVPKTDIDPNAGTAIWRQSDCGTVPGALVDGGIGSGNTTGNVSAARAFVHRTRTFDKIRCYLYAVGTAATNFRMGVWSAEGVLLSSSVDYANVALTTGLKEVALETPLLLKRGQIVYLGFGNGGSTGSFSWGRRASVNSLVMNSGIDQGFPPPTWTKAGAVGTTGVPAALSDSTTRASVIPWLELTGPAVI